MQTALGSAMKAAGVDTDAALLHSIAVDLLRKNCLDARRSLEEFVDNIRDNGGLIAALHSREETKHKGLEYLQRVARDMRGGTMSRQGREGADRPPNGDDAEFSRPYHSRDEREGEPGEGLISNGVVAPPNSVDEAGLERGGPPGVHDRPWRIQLKERQGMGRAERPAARTVISPGHPKRGFAELKAIKEALPTIFDTRKLRDGTSLGDLRWSQLDRFIASNAQEAALLRMVRDHARPADSNARIRDVVSLETMQRFLQKAAEIADAN